MHADLDERELQSLDALFPQDAGLQPVRNELRRVAKSSSRATVYTIFLAVSRI